MQGASEGLTAIVRYKRAWTNLRLSCPLCLQDCVKLRDWADAMRQHKHVAATCVSPKDVSSTPWSNGEWVSGTKSWSTRCS